MFILILELSSSYNVFGTNRAATDKKEEIQRKKQC